MYSKKVEILIQQVRTESLRFGRMYPTVLSLPVGADLDAPIRLELSVILVPRDRRLRSPGCSTVQSQSLAGQQRDVTRSNSHPRRPRYTDRNCDFMRLNSTETKRRFVITASQWTAEGSVFGAVSLWGFCLCMKYLGNRWTDLHQIHKEDVFGPSLGPVWRSTSRSPETCLLYTSPSPRD